jgi:serine/threonine protein kinase
MDRTKTIAKISDFGLSTYFSSSTEIKLTECVGSKLYVAPETLIEPHYNQVNLLFGQVGKIQRQLIFGQSGLLHSCS